MKTPLRLRSSLACAALALVLAAPLGAQALARKAGPAPEAPTPTPNAGRLPPAGIKLYDTDRTELTEGVTALRRKIDAAAREIATKDPGLQLLLPDIEIYHKAVDWALRYDEFFDEKQIAVARHLLSEGVNRAEELAKGKAPWTTETGTVLRGYKSRIDDSIQPYAVVIPISWRRNEVIGRRLDVVLAGRGEKRSELAFLAEHETNPGEIVPPSAIVLHPYGRYCNATKFAGESDVFEAMTAVQQRYNVDSDRIIVRGFSMGGASTWHLATHHPGVWAAASPGAGFAETAVYTKALASGKELRPVWEQKLWKWYDATAYAANLFNVPTIAYSGELDPQKQSADIMEEAMAAEGLTLERIIGPATAHKYEAGAKNTLRTRLDAFALKGREPAKEVHLTTYTLQYPRNNWVAITALEKHWDRADVVAKLDGTKAVTVTTKNVAGLQLTPPDEWRGGLTVDGQKVPQRDDLQIGAGVFLVKTDGKWTTGILSGRRKTIGITGPIDDAFMDAFVFVRPTSQPLNTQVGAWVQSELAHATRMWRDIFRGEAPVKDDSAITADDVLNKNLILWGDPSSNDVIAQIVDRLPVKWDKEKLVFHGETYDAAHHAPILIFPNPLNPRRYVVLNSGIDFRNEAYGTNALQTPKLPDYAIVDLRTPAGPRWPGKIVEAGFFDEEWK
jgi:pimeloyl-ACP methyl ester carboxylesterase